MLCKVGGGGGWNMHACSSVFCPSCNTTGGFYVGNQDVLQDTGCFVIGYMPLAGPIYAVGCRMLGVGCWKGLILVISEGGHRTIDYTTIHPSSHR
mmetsp:Transcript_28371/g.43464  ORF Transcript_28371/g.43464 Transcript_28371/m.43464 type:complete len:95 (+) Transcript_28371:110-394(+)